MTGLPSLASAVVRIGLLFLFAVTMPFLHWRGLVVSAALIILLALLIGTFKPRVLVSAVYRMRWLLLSLAVIYVFFAADVDQRVVGVERVSMLIILIMAVKIFLLGLNASALADGFSEWFARLGCKLPRLSRRLALTLDYADKALARKKPLPKLEKAKAVDALVHYLAEQIVLVEQRNGSSSEPITMNTTSKLNRYGLLWLILVALLLGFMLAIGF